MSPTPLGVELVHLVGNGPFLFAALAMVAATAAMRAIRGLARGGQPETTDAIYM